jgi:hypothetical protein
MVSTSRRASRAPRARSGAPASRWSRASVQSRGRAQARVHRLRAARIAFSSAARASASRGGPRAAAQLDEGVRDARAVAEGLAVRERLAHRRERAVRVAGLRERDAADTGGAGGAEAVADGLLRRDGPPEHLERGGRVPLEEQQRPEAPERPRRAPPVADGLLLGDGPLDGLRARGGSPASRAGSRVAERRRDAGAVAARGTAPARPRTPRARAQSPGSRGRSRGSRASRCAHRVADLALQLHGALERREARSTSPRSTARSRPFVATATARRSPRASASASARS